MPAEPDGDVLRRFVLGDEGAFEQLFRQFEADVYRWIVRIVRDRSAAEDVLVEAFWRAYRGRARFDPSRSFGAWIRRIATNVALDHRRASRAVPAESVSAHVIPAGAGSDDEITEAIALAFRKLPPKLHIVTTL